MLSQHPTPAHHAHHDATEPTLAERHERRLVMALGLFDLTDRDRQLIAWLATWDQPTVEGIEDLLARAVSPRLRSATRGGHR